MIRSGAVVVLGAALVATLAAVCAHAQSQRTVKPVLHGRHWVAITGKPVAATAGAMTFAKGGNAVDAAAAMLAPACTMWDTLGWGGETQTLVFDPRTKAVIGLNALGVAPSGATPELYKAQKLRYPPSNGPLAAVTPGTPGGLITMLAEWGRLSRAMPLQPRPLWVRPDKAKAPALPPGPFGGRCLAAAPTAGIRSTAGRACLPP